MRKYIGRSFAVAAFAAAAMAPTHAIVISGTEVGSLDSYLGACAPGSSGDAVELACISSLSGTTATLVEKVDATGFTLLSDGTLRAIDVSPDSPGYYLLKFGAPGKDAVDSFVFQNLASLNFLAWNMTTLTTVYEIRGLSHYMTASSTTTTTTGGGTTTSSTSSGVPEPGTGSLALLGLAALGAGFVLRRKQAASRS